MACSDYQNECLRVITIDYLKNFVGTVIDIDNNTVTVTGNNNTYCPTYNELTNGTFTKYYVNGKTGIQVTGTYASNQLVRQKDLRFIHTVFKSLTVNSSKNPLNACGDSATLSPSYTFTQTTKYMNDSCSTATTSTDISQSLSNTITYTSSNLDFTINGNTLSVGKNGGSSGGGDTVTTYDITPSDSTSAGGNITFTATSRQVSSKYVLYPADAYQEDRYSKEVWFSFDAISAGGGPITPGTERSTIVTGHVTVNGIARTGNSATITQPAVRIDGDTGNRVGYYEKPTGLSVITSDANGNPSSVEYIADCGPTFYAKGTGTYDIYGSYSLSDECGGSSSTAVTVKKEGSATANLGVKSLKMSIGCGCPTSSETGKIVFDWGGFTGSSHTFTGECDVECSDCGGCKKLTDDDGHTLHIGNNGSGAGESIFAPGGVTLSTSDNWITVPSGVQKGSFSFNVKSNGGGTRTGSISVSRASASDTDYCSSGTITISQASAGKKYCKDKTTNTWSEVDRCGDNCKDCL